MYVACGSCGTGLRESAKFCDERGADLNAVADPLDAIVGKMSARPAIRKDGRRRNRLSPADMALKPWSLPSGLN